jgi:hypothetical protein
MYIYIYVFYRWHILYNIPNVCIYYVERDILCNMLYFVIKTQNIIYNVYLYIYLINTHIIHRYIFYVCVVISIQKIKGTCGSSKIITVL